MFKRTFVAASIAALSLTGLVAAQESATVTLRSGERLNAQVVDLGGVGYTVRVDGQERQIPANDVAVIDFSGGNINDIDWSKVSGGQHVIFLKNGQTLSGQMVDIGGTSPLRITFRADSGERDIPSSEISRIVLSRPTATAVPQPAPTTGGSTSSVTTSGTGQVTITVSPQQRWTPTTVAVRRGDFVTFTTTGDIRLSASPDDMANPEGSRNGRFDTGAPLPQTPAGALIGRVGNGKPFVIGLQTRVQMPDSGQLFLGVNDGHLGDNDGTFTVVAQREGGPLRR